MPLVFLCMMQDLLPATTSHNGSAGALPPEEGDRLRTDRLAAEKPQLQVQLCIDYKKKSKVNLMGNAWGGWGPSLHRPPSGEATAAGDILKCTGGPRQPQKLS